MVPKGPNCVGKAETVQVDLEMSDALVLEHDGSKLLRCEEIGHESANV